MRSSLCGKEGGKEQNVRGEIRELNTQRKIVPEHKHNISCRKRHRRKKCGAYWVSTTGVREIVGREKIKPCACPPERAAQISAMLSRIKEQAQCFSACLYSV